MPDIRKVIYTDKKTNKKVALDIVSKVDTTLTQENIPADAKTIGDKLATLNDKIANLQVEGGSSVFNADTHFDFPSIGSVDMIYKAYKEKKTYQWNATELKYEALDEDILDDISLINGGTANG